MISLGSEELTISKLDNMELREITRITRSNINSRVRSRSKQEQNLIKNRK
jgi:hypothetical protein